MRRNLWAIEQARRIRGSKPVRPVSPREVGSGKA